MSLSLKFASTAHEIEQIIQLRYEVLRAPWQQPADTATDALEESSFNAYILDEAQTIIACGRLQKNSETLGQIRFMAVSPLFHRKGLGRLIVKAIEDKARDLGLRTIELQARENAVPFYKAEGYEIQEKSFLLWGQIQHYLMRKGL
jgi:N-acetylglutamate synthase-like GNAT family acetyltransferase